MSSNASSSRNSLTGSRPQSSRGSRRKTAENWDDDFEFSLPARPRNSTVAKHSRKRSSIASIQLHESQNDQQPAAPPVKTSSKGKGRESPTESWADSPPPSPTTKKHQKHPNLAPIEVSAPIRSSASITPGLPTPELRTAASTTSPLSQTSSNPLQPLLAADIPLPATIAERRHRSGSRSSVNKLVKRHPSTSFIPMSHPDQSTSSISILSSTGSVQYNNQLNSNQSLDQMPPPPIPYPTSGRPQSRGDGRTRPVSRGNGEVRVSNIPFSPSHDDMRGQSKKQGFWKRLSGVPDRKPETTSPGARVRRSSSVGSSSSPTNRPNDLPPVPPLPQNIRSSSSTSTSSNISSASASSSNRSGIKGGISGMLRKSRSSLNAQNSNTPPISFPAGLEINTANNAPYQIPSTPPRSHSFSRGFHLPSPATGSPYHPAAASFSTSSLPHSGSLPDQRDQLDLSDVETEKNGRTPRRKKIRPASALPAPRSASTRSDWDSELPGAAPEMTLKQVLASRPDSRSSLHRHAMSEVPTVPAAPPSPKANGFAASTTSTLRRISSISKKHGRRLSGGFKFGNSTTSANETRRASGEVRINPLETVVGSPSKPVETRHLADPSVELDLNTVIDAKEKAMRAEMRGASVSAPNSRFQAPAGVAFVPSQINASKSGEDLKAIKKDKEKRRQSWNDFVIPKTVLEKQRELRKSVGAVKMFAGGVEKLKRHIDAHGQIQDRLDGNGDISAKQLFDELEAEFRQWWEMATVLIEVGSTGMQMSNQASTDSLGLDHTTRSRRITLASDEAKQASDILRQAGTLSKLESMGSEMGPRKTSLPDPPIDAVQSLRVEKPEHWRASTGRQDLSKRQLEVLRTMLRTPVPGPSTPDPRTVGSKGMSSSTSQQQHPTATMRRLPASTPGEGGQTPLKRELSGVTFPSPAESSHVVPSSSFPSPITASSLAQPNRPPLKARRSSKAGLAGLKDFLRSLKKDSPNSKSDGATSRNRSQRATPEPPSRQHSTSPPISPMTPASQGGFEEVFFPNSQLQPQSTMTASTLGSVVGVSSQNNRDTLPFTGSGQQPLKRVPSPEKTARRPNIRNIFRTSSGNWSDLVKGNNQATLSNAPPSAGPVTYLLERRASKKSQEGKRRSIDSGHSEHQVPSPSLGDAGESGISGLPRRRSSHKKLEKPPKTPTTGGFSFTPPWKSPMSPKSKKTTSINPSPTPIFQSPKLGEGDIGKEQTVRPRGENRKSWVAGLGNPSSPATPPRHTQWPESATSSQPRGSPYATSNTVNLNRDEGSPMGNKGQRQIAVSNPHYDQAGGGTTGSPGVHDAPRSASAPMPGSGEGYQNMSRSTSGMTHSSTTTSRRGLQSGGEENEDLVVALTPENLPVLLEYQRQCESKLSDWQKRVSALLEQGRS